MRERPAEKRVPSVRRAAGSPAAIVLAGAGVAAGELAHLGNGVAIVLGLAGYGARLGWESLRRRAVQRRRALRDRIDPWSLPEPWRGQVARSLDARKQFCLLVGSLPPGPISGTLAAATGTVEEAVAEHWALAKGAAAFAGEVAPEERVTELLSTVPGRLEAVVMAAGRVVSAASTGADGASLEPELGLLAQALEEARRVAVGLLRGPPSS
jgi:hypothetical protein